MDEDEIAGTARGGIGRIEAAIAHATGDETTEARGRARQALGGVQQGYGKVRRTVRELIDETPALATGRDYARRGAAIVTRSAVDNSAITAAVASVAVAAVSWLVIRSIRGAKRDR